MTTPTNATDGDGGRHYAHPARPGVDYLSVTTAISNGVPKQLDNWFKKQTAIYAVDNLDLLKSLDRDAAIDLAKRECDRIRDAAGDRGTVTHALVEAAGTVDPAAYLDFETYKAAAIGAAGNVWLDGVMGYVDAGLRFLWDWRPQIAAAEVTVYSHRWAYAGTLDLLATLPVLGAGLLDWKTSSDIYAETALQLAAYRFADVALIDGEDRPVPEVQFAAAIHLKADGTYNLVVLKAGPDEHRLFLGALATARFTLEQAKSVRLAEYTAPPADRPWWATGARREWLVERIGTLRDSYPAGLAMVAARWPAGVPTFKAAEHHTHGQLQAINDVVTAVEAELEIPFGPGDPVPNVGGIPLAGDDVCRVLQDRIDALPIDLGQVVAAKLHTADFPQLLGGRFTIDHAEALEQIVSPLEVEAAQRQAALYEVLGDFARDADVVTAVLVRATDGAHVSPHRMTEDQLERARLLAAAVEHGALALQYLDDGQLVLIVPPAMEARLLIGHGNSKATLLDAGRSAAKQLGLPTPRGSAQVVAEPLIVARLAESLGAQAA